MIYGSVCSGIEAATVAWEGLGWRPAWFAEILPFPSAVLACRYPGTENLGDMTRIYDNETFKRTAIDLLVGGTPCQSFSFAGNRGGLDDPRGNLAIEFLRIARVKTPRWFVWENVTGVISSGGGRHFGTFLGEVAKLGYCCAWRVLDASSFGVPQRRRRVFVVGHIGDWRPPVAVLFGPEDLCGDCEKDKGAGKDRAAAVLRGADEGDGAIGVDVYNYRVTGSMAVTLGANCGSKNSHGPKVLDARGIRLHTPTECERLQGFPDGYTDIPYPSRNPDQRRYAALGNSMPVPVMRWIGGRIDMFERLAAERTMLSGGTARC